MNFTVSEAQQELVRSVRKFLADKSPNSEVRRLMETSQGYDAAVWTQMASQLGLTGLIIPEEYGGSGLSCAVKLIDAMSGEFEPGQQVEILGNAPRPLHIPAVFLAMQDSGRGAVLISQRG